MMSLTRFIKGLFGDKDNNAIVYSSHIASQEHAGDRGGLPSEGPNCLSAVFFKGSGHGNHGYDDTSRPEAGYVQVNDAAGGRVAHRAQLFNSLHPKGGPWPTESFGQMQLQVATYKKMLALGSRAARKAALKLKPPAQRGLVLQDSCSAGAQTEVIQERATCPAATTRAKHPVAVVPTAPERHTFPRAQVNQGLRPHKGPSEQDWSDSPRPAGDEKLSGMGPLFPATPPFASPVQQPQQRPAVAAPLCNISGLLPPMAPQLLGPGLPHEPCEVAGPEGLTAAKEEQQEQGRSLPPHDHRHHHHQQQQRHQHWRQVQQLQRQQAACHDLALPFDQGMEMEVVAVSDGLLFLAMDAPVSMLPPDSIWSSRAYRIVHQLHRGYASCVFKALCRRSSTEVVLKAYHLTGLSEFLLYQVLRELDIHSRLRHEGVVRLLAAFKEGDTLVMVLEHAGGGSACRVRRKLGGRMSEFQAMHLVLLPLLGVLSHLHEQGIVHRDIKPENLLFTESWQLKLCDFGVSICLREERAVTRTGSREYMAPEVSTCPLKHLPEDNKENLQLAYTAAVDIWSLGSLMYELLVGFTPFPGGPPPRREGARGSAGAPLAFPGGISQAARAFVRDCLQLDPADRPTVHQLMKHAWVREALADAPGGSERALLEAEERRKEKRGTPNPQQQQLCGGRAVQAHSYMHHAMVQMGAENVT